MKLSTFWGICEAVEQGDAQAADFATLPSRCAVLRFWVVQDMICSGYEVWEGHTNGEWVDMGVCVYIGTMTILQNPSQMQRTGCKKGLYYAP